jgi:signal transduction histidine kinase
VVTDALAASQLAARRGRVEIRHEHIPSVTAECDPARVRQVVDNLISNAIKYTPAGGTVTVSLAHDDDDAVFTVSDSGFGITDDEKPLVFDRFFRGRIAQEQAVQGVGIGLTIVKEAAEAHGGTVAIDSTVGTGTTVTVRLPLRVAA